MDVDGDLQQRSVDSNGVWCWNEKKMTKEAVILSV